MNNIYALVIVAVVFAIALVIIVQQFLKKLNFNESLMLQGELKKQRQDFFLAHRMEAYQRVILYMERIHPSSIVLRMNQPNMNALVLQTMVLKAIRDEYDHNVAQQMFISSNAWNLLKNAKEETVKLINVAASQLGSEASANDLATAVITLSAEINPLPSEIAINALKAEFQQLF
ncbi:MAG: hypothetical protein ACK5F0_08830 [Flavobacteriales bacterium]|jgi:hypothetical protein